MSWKNHWEWICWIWTSRWSFPMFFNVVDWGVASAYYLKIAWNCCSALYQCEKRVDDSKGCPLLNVKLLWSFYSTGWKCDHIYIGQSQKKIQNKHPSPPWTFNKKECKPDRIFLILIEEVSVRVVL